MDRAIFFSPQAGREITAPHVAKARFGIGDVVLIGTGERALPAEVVAVSGSSSVVMPLGSLDGVAPNDPAELVGGRLSLLVGDGLKGRVLDALGHPIDGRGPIEGRV